MAIQIKHAFVSLKGDGTDATQVQPSHWNSAHSATMATGNLVGRLSAGAGAMEEIPVSAFMASLLNTADITALGAILGLFEAGDTKYTFRGTASTGWVLLTSASTVYTVGNAASGANLRASADCLNLFTAIYNGVADAQAPVSGGRTGNATNDFNSGKTIRVPNLVGRSPIGAGAGTSDITAKTIGGFAGEEAHTQTISEMPSHFHGAGIYDPAHTHSWTNSPPPQNVNNSSTPGGAFGIMSTNGGTTVSSASTGVRVTSSNGTDNTYSAGGGAAFNVIHPVVGLNVMVKL